MFELQYECIYFSTSNGQCKKDAKYTFYFNHSKKCKRKPINVMSEMVHKKCEISEIDKLCNPMTCIKRVFFFEITVFSIEQLDNNNIIGDAQWQRSTSLTL